MNFSNNEYYIICLVIFVLFLFIMHKNEGCKYNKNSKTTTSNDKFANTENLQVYDYINDNISGIYKKLNTQSIGCQKEINRHTDNCKFGGDFEETSNHIKAFNNRLNIYSKYVQDEVIDKKVENIQKQAEELKGNDSKIYGELVHTGDSPELQDSFLSIMDRLNQQIDSNQGLSYNPELHAEGFQSVVNPADLCGTYTIVPYQYKNFNNIHIVLNLKDGCDNNSDNSISFFLVDNTNTNTNKKHLVTYNINTIAFVDSSILQQLDQQQSENTGGIEFFISQKIIANDMESDVLKLILKVLDDIGFTVGEKYYFFLANDEYNKILYNVNKPEYEGNKLFGNDETKYYLKNKEKMYRIYNQHSRMLISMIR